MTRVLRLLSGHERSKPSVVVELMTGVIRDDANGCHSSREVPFRKPELPSPTERSAGDQLQR